MYRIKLATGTVLEFDSLESLTVDIHAGVVDAEALIFHQRANQWLPIHVHPVWKQALAAPRKAPAPPMSRSEPRGDGRSTSTPRSAPKSSAAIPENRLPGSGTAVESRNPLAGSHGSGTATKSTAAARVASAAAASFAAKGNAAVPGTATITAGPRVAAAQVSVDHLDEDLELLAPDELPAPASSAVAASAPAPSKPDAPKPGATKATTPSRTKLVIKTPATAPSAPAAAPAPMPTAAAAAPLLVEPLDENTELEIPEASDTAREPLVTEDVASEVPLDFIPVEPSATESMAPAAPVAEPAAPATPAAAAEESTEPAATTASSTATRSEAVASAPVAQPAASAAESTAPDATPGSVASAPSEPVASASAASPAPVAATAPSVAAPVLATPAAPSRVLDRAIAPEPLAIVEAGAVVVDPPAELMTDTVAEPAVFTLPTATMPRAAGSNRTLLYIGGAVAAAAIVSVALLRGSKRGDAASTADSPRRTVNAAIPTSPLTPPGAELNDVGAAATDSIVALGRIERPVVVAKPAPAAPPVRRTPEQRADEPAATAKSPKPAKAAADTTPEIVAAPVGVGALTAPAPLEPTASLAPDVMAGRYTAAHNAAWNDLVTRLRLAGFDNLFAPARVAPSGAIGARATVAAARTHIAEWRKRAAAVEKAYRDSAATLVSRGVWSSGEQKAFEARATRGESGESAQRTNAILGASDRLFGILAVNAGTYAVGPDGLRFADSGPQREYWETRRALVAAIGTAGTPAAQSPLQIVLKAIGGARPPEGVNVN